MTQAQDHPTIQWWRGRSAMPSAMAAIPLNAESLRELCLAARADDVGFVEIDRPEIADQRDNILAAFPRTKTLISFVCRMNQENVQTPLRSIANTEFHASGEEINHVGRAIVERLTAIGIGAGVLRQEQPIFWALLRRKIRVKGSLKLLQAFGRCFPA